MSNPLPQSQFAPPAYPPPPQPQQSSGSGCWLYLLIGCLGSVVLGVVLCAGGVWWLSKYGPNMVASIAREGMVAVINESELDPQEKTEVIAQIDRVVNAFKNGKLKPEELQTLLQELEDSPVIALLQFYGIEKMYVEPSGLTAEEKTAAKRTLARAFRGFVEKKITQQEFEGSLPASMRQGQGGKADPNARPTDEEVKELLTNLKKLADDAEIPDEDFQIDISDELKKDIDKVLAGKE